MPRPANEELLSRTVRHRVDVQRYGTGVMNRVQKILRQGENDLISRLMARSKDNWTTRRVSAILRELGEISLENYKFALGNVADEMGEFVTAEADHAQSLLEDTPVKMSITQPSEQQLVAIVSKEPITVGPDGKLLMKEIFQGLAAGREKDIRQAVRLGMTEGEPIEDIVRRLIGTRANNYNDGIMAKNRRGARAMVRTIVNHISNRAAAMTYEENQDVIKGEQWVSTLDTRTTPICQSRDGKIFPVGEGPRPPAHVNCRSFMAPVLKSWKEMGIDAEEMTDTTRASMNGQVPASMTYSKWLKANPQYAEEVLGPARAKMFLSGRVSLDKFVDDDGHELTLAEIKRNTRR